MNAAIDKYQDVIDSRDVVARIEELQDFQTEEGLMNPDALEELRILMSLASEAEGSPDWRHGETLIRDSYFKEYAQELAEDCGMIPRDLNWPCNCIDWEQAARELRDDYFSVDFDGVTYWIRA